MGRLLALLAAVVVAAACDPGSHQLWVVNERPEAVVVKLELLAEGLTPLPGEEPLDYTIPARSEACTYCGMGSFPRARFFVYTADFCDQLGAAVLTGANSYVVTVPPTGLVILDHGGRPPDPSRGLAIRAAETTCR